MKTSKVQNYILFTLGKWFEEANKKIKNSSLKVSISKTTFIDLVKTAKFAKKQERALYKNLEILEKKKLVEYKNKELELTKKGKKLYEEINDSLKPFFNVFKKLKDKNPIGYTKKVQTIFK
jgi:Mn-dependent DtxR family transcriptional regulator